MSSQARVTPGTARWQLCAFGTCSGSSESSACAYVPAHRSKTITSLALKVDVKGLKHSTQYYYMFHNGGAKSPMGKFRLPPPEGASLEQVRYGVYTCSSWGWGYFNAYDYGAQLDLDFWMHMGDYIYGAASS